MMLVIEGISMTNTNHWSEVYQATSSDAVSWYQPSCESSLRAIEQFAAAKPGSLIDVGGGASHLVDRLSGKGWTDLTVLDLAAPALDVVKARLSKIADAINWVVADITQWLPARTYDVWHDRAVFHFLTDAEQRAGYRQALDAGIVRGGLVIVATFALDGPERCSGLWVERYDAAKLSDELGPDFQLLTSWREVHLTPWQSDQAFNWCVFRRI